MNPKTDCGRCGGKGTIRAPGWLMRVAFGLRPQLRDCHRCGGSGKKKQ